MPVLVTVKFKGDVQERLRDYEKVSYELIRRGLTTESAENISHVFCEIEDGAMAVDVWSSRQAWDDFLNNHLLASIQAAGVTAQPEIKVYETYNVGFPGRFAEAPELRPH